MPTVATTRPSLRARTSRITRTVAPFTRVVPPVGARKSQVSLRGTLRVGGNVSVEAVAGVLAPAANYDNVVALGTAKANMSVAKIAAMGVMGGLFIGFGAFLAASVGGACGGMAAAGNPGLQKIITGLFGLPFGLLMVLTCGAELFTGNTALVTAAVYEGKANWSQLVKSFFVSYIGNFVGSLLLVYMVYQTGLFGATSAPVGMAVAKTSLTFSQAFFRGVLCNFLVCIAIVQASSAHDFAGKAVGVLMPISAFIALGLEHSVANMFIIPMGIALGAKVSFAHFLTANLIPVTLGNIVGGALFVATAYSFIFGALGGKK